LRSFREKGPRMNIETYRSAYFTNPPPEPRFQFESLNAFTLYFQQYEKALEFYTAVLGTPDYKEGESTHGWRIGTGWLTLLKGCEGNPKNIELSIIMPTPHEAERLQLAFIEEGAVGHEPADVFMYEAVHVCPVKDPFGTEIMIFSRYSDPNNV